MRRIDSTSQMLASKIKDQGPVNAIPIPPDILASLVVALIQMVSICLKRDNPQRYIGRVVTPKDIMIWLHAEDAPFGLKWLWKGIRRNRFANEVIFRCTAKKDIPNNQADVIRDVIVDEAYKLDLQAFEEMFTEAGGRK